MEGQRSNSGYHGKVFDERVEVPPLQPVQLPLQQIYPNSIGHGPECPGYLAYPPHGSGEASDAYTFPSAAFSRYPQPSYRHPSCPHPIRRSCKNSIASTSLHPNSKANSVAYFTGRSMCNVCQTFRATTWCGLLTIWTRYVAASPFRAPRSSYGRLQIILILQVLLPGSVYANSEGYVAPG